MFLYCRSPVAYRVVSCSSSKAPAAMLALPNGAGYGGGANGSEPAFTVVDDAGLLASTKCNHIIMMSISLYLYLYAYLSHSLSVYYMYV